MTLAPALPADPPQVPPTTVELAHDLRQLWRQLAAVVATSTTPNPN